MRNAVLNKNEMTILEALGEERVRELFAIDLEKFNKAVADNFEKDIEIFKEIENWRG